MNKTLLYFCLLSLVILLTACGSNVQNLSSMLPSENVQKTSENSISDVTAASTTEPTKETELPTTESSSTPIQTGPIVESSTTPTEKVSKPTPLPPQNTTSNEKIENTPAAETINLPAIEPDTKTKANTMIDLIINIGEKSFTAKLFDNASTQALIAQMPMTLDMSEMNGNEKYYYLSSALPTASEHIGSIHTGDLMLYGSDCLVLFYEDFQTSYNYTKLDYIVDATGLADALGSNGIQVTFSIVST